ncbi:MAG TPA: Vps62-related protein [Thermoanaerobaculia bacterium]|jgi:hypothetical protein|nr:Vps62-related protein [Thermoanaerobaculia bacterium]
MPINADPNALVQRFRPLYKLHSEEMWYPCHPEDQLRCANLISVADGSTVIPALRAEDGSAADQFLCTPLGLQQLAERGVPLDRATIAELQWNATPSSQYAFFRPSSKYVIARADDGFPSPFGALTSTNYQPQNATWFHRGAPNNPLVWLGGDPSSYAPAALDPPHGTLRGVWQEPVTSAWVQTHTVAGIEYVDLIYTAFLAWNGSISILAGQGEHPNDVETTIVRLHASDLDHPVRVYFQQHSGFAWYDTTEVERAGDRVIVYLARQSHECYAHAGRYTRIFGFADDLCDGGLTWDAPVIYTDRPQGMDRHGIDTDALRCSLAAGGDPNDIVLVPLEDLGPLWQYVRFQFLARRPADVPLSDDDFLYQPFPLSTTKWWPEEGPAATDGPLAMKAGETSGPGVPNSFFHNVATYLGANPKPACSRTASLAKPPTAAPQSPAAHAVAATVDTRTIAGSAIGGSVIGGPTAALAPNAPFVDWRGEIGTYLLGSINAQLPKWIGLLPDPLVLKDIRSGPITIRELSIAGLRGLSIAPAAATSATTAATSASSERLDVTVIVSNDGNSGALSLHLSDVTVSATATFITPIAIPQTTPAQWYVPYVGPSPYSYGAKPWSTTTAINNGSVSPLTISFDSISVDVGSPILEIVIDVILALVRETIEHDASAALASAINGYVKSVYDGTRRVG